MVQFQHSFPPTLMLARAFASDTFTVYYNRIIGRASFPHPLTRLSAKILNIALSASTLIKYWYWLSRNFNHLPNEREPPPPSIYVQKYMRSPAATYI